MGCKSPIGIVFGKILGLVFFLILLSIATILAPKGGIIERLVEFFLNNMAFILLISVFGMLTESFFALKLPFKLAAPFFSAILGPMVATFIIMLFMVLNVNIWSLSPWIQIIVGMICFIGGYGTIIADFAKSPDTKKPKQQKKNDDAEWKEVGSEFRKALKSFFIMVNEAFEKDKEANKKK